MFGHIWNVPDDILAVKFPVYLSRKKRSVKSEPDLTVADFEKLRTMRLCKMNLLGFVNGIGDPLGIGSPWYMTLKLLMKKLYQLEAPLSWDEKIRDGNHDEWIHVMTGFGDGTLPGFG